MAFYYFGIAIYTTECSHTHSSLPPCLFCACGPMRSTEEAAPIAPGAVAPTFEFCVTHPTHPGTY